MKTLRSTLASGVFTALPCAFYLANVAPFRVSVMFNSALLDGSMAAAAGFD
jgi:hypothetical protein